MLTEGSAPAQAVGEVGTEQSGVGKVGAWVPLGKGCGGRGLLEDQPQGMPSILNHVLLFLFYLRNTSLLNSVTTTTSLLLDPILFFVLWLNRMTECAFVALSSLLGL